jgi:GNAT superfamily N-acetyltransferase
MIDMGIKIKKVNPHREETKLLLNRLQKECLPYDQPYSTDSGYWWVAFDGDDAIGFAGFTQTRQWLDCAYLCRAGVVSRYRGHGLQKRFIDIRARYAKRIGYNWMITDTTDNYPSANSLISCGFRLYEPAQKWAFKHSLYWRKRL